MRLHNIHDDDDNEALYNSHPTFQVLSIKNVGPGRNGQDRHRVIVSDGEHFLQAMLVAQINQQADRGELMKNSVIVADKFTCPTVGESKKYAYNFRVRLCFLMRTVAASLS